MAQKIIDKNSFRVKEYPVQSEKVVFVFTAMATKINLYRLFAMRMNKKGYSCIVYDYPLRMLFKPKLDEWEKFYDDIIADAQSRLSAYHAHGANKFYSYGVSMGTLIANKLTQDTPEITHLILNLTYGDVARNIWTYRRLGRTRRRLLKQGINEQALRDSIKYADPIVNASKLKGKKIRLYLSKADNVLPYEQTKYTKQAFADAELDFEYVEDRHLGHYLGATKNMMAIKEIDSFYKM